MEIQEDRLHEVHAEYDGPGEHQYNFKGRCPHHTVWKFYVQECATRSNAASHGSVNAVGTPFEGGVFKMKLVLGSDFPNVPPKGIYSVSCGYAAL